MFLSDPVFAHLGELETEPLAGSSAEPESQINVELLAAGPETPPVSVISSGDSTRFKCSSVIDGSDQKCHDTALLEIVIEYMTDEQVVIYFVLNRLI